MPKVKEDYFEDKRNQILDAAFRVCNRKPAYDVTMSNIVEETGMSQGGVYKYFNNIDLVLAALIDRANQSSDYKEQIDMVMTSDNSAEIKLRDLFKISEQCFSDMLISYNKILYELGTFFAYSPKRCERINRNVTTSSAFEYLTQCAAKVIISGTEEGFFKPVMPIQDVIAFVVASFDGIIRDVTITKCYSKDEVPATEIVFDEKKLIQGLYLSTIALLGGSHEERDY